MPVPFVDLSAQYRSIKELIDRAMADVIDRCAFVGGQAVKQFEQDFASYCALRAEAAPAAPSSAPAAPDLFCASCGNGTDALYLTLRAMGIGPGDEVITVAHTFIATAEAITLTGATPVFVDVRSDTLLMDADLIEPAITDRTKAILPVHLYGQPCDMTRINDIAARHDLKVIEDAAQSHGATFEGKRPGALSDAACFSFYPGKNLGAYGDGGAVVSADAQLIEKIKMLSNHGRLEKYTHQIEGVNSRLDGIQAAVLSVKLKHLDQWNQARRSRAAGYLEALADSDLTLPTTDPQTNPVWHLFVVRSSDRDALAARLKGQQIATGIHYPIPLHLQPAYSYLNLPPGSLPVTEQAASQILSLPMFPELTDLQIDQVASAIRATSSEAR
jgi:dTDP-4-amino-4,6-dideoxygalactose transaminase